MSEKMSQPSREKPVSYERPESTRHISHEDATEQHSRKSSERTHDIESAVDSARIHAHTISEKLSGDRNKSPAEKRPRAPSKSHREHAFKETMKEIQDEMNPASQLASKFFHIPSVEKVADITGNSLFRPNALLSGSIFAFACITILYFIAKNYGYQLSGFETLAAFVVGWLLGVGYDIVRRLISRH